VDWWIPGGDGAVMVMDGGWSLCDGEAMVSNEKVRRCPPFIRRRSVVCRLVSCPVCPDVVRPTKDLVYRGINIICVRRKKLPAKSAVVSRVIMSPAKFDTAQQNNNNTTLHIYPQPIAHHLFLPFIHLPPTTIIISSPWL
jgi:hypothetical protein